MLPQQQALCHRRVWRHCTHEGRAYGAIMNPQSGLGRIQLPLVKEFGDLFEAIEDGLHGRSTGTGNREPSGFNLAQQAIRFLHLCGVILRMRLDQATPDVVVDRLQPVGDFTPGLMIQRAAQTVDNIERRTDVLTFTGDIALFQQGHGGLNALTRATQQQAHQTMRTGTLNRAL